MLPVGHEPPLPRCGQEGLDDGQDQDLQPGGSQTDSEAVRGREQEENGPVGEVGVVLRVVLPMAPEALRQVQVHQQQQAQLQELCDGGVEGTGNPGDAGAGLPRQPPYLRV